MLAELKMQKLCKYYHLQASYGLQKLQILQFAGFIWFAENVQILPFSGFIWFAENVDILQFSGFIWFAENVQILPSAGFIWFCYRNIFFASKVELIRVLSLPRKNRKRFAHDIRYTSAT